MAAYTVEPEPVYMGGTALYVSAAVLEQFGPAMAAAAAIGRCIREIDPYAYDRWADDGGRVP